MTRLDFNGDVAYTQLQRLHTVYDLPDFVKEAAVEDLQLPPKRGQYADAITKQFPCHTKAATVLSLGYFLENSDSLTEKQRTRIGSELAKFANFWGIRPIMEAMTQRKAELSKEAQTVELTDSNFALVKQAEDGTVTREYPLRNSKEVRAAAEWFTGNLPALREEYPFRDRLLMATRILDKAADYGVAIDDLQETLEKCAGLGMTAPSDIARHLSQRQTYLRTTRVVPEVIEGLGKLAALVRNKPQNFLDMHTLQDLAETVDFVDRTCGLLNKYSELLPAPEDITFGVTQSKMAEIRDIAFETSVGSVYTTPQLAKISLAQVRDLLGDEVANQVRHGIDVDREKLADVVATLPRPDAETFDDLMASTGEFPVKRAAFRTGLDPTVLTTLAGLSHS